MKSAKTISSAMQTLTFSRRATVVGGLQIGVGVLLAGRMAYISVAENERYKLLSESNRVNLTLVPPRRGWLIDRNGKPIANNKTDFRVDIIPDRLRDKKKTVATLAELLALDAEDLERINRELEQASSFQPVQVATGLDWEAYAAVSVRLPDLPGVSPRQGFSRNYPSGPAIGHLVGYVGTASAEEYKEKPDPILITPGYKIGKDGLEKIFEDRLQGKPGAKRVEVTARGKIVRELRTRADVPGKAMQLTLDIDLQEYAARRLGTQSGSVVVMDCESGDILTMTSMPSFDPNSFSDGIGVTEYGMLREDDHVPLLDKSLKSLFPPGSTVKPMVALAFLEAGLSPDESVNCNGGLQVGNRRFRCWKRGGHGRVDMAKGIYQSCDVYFYHFAQKIGINPIALMANRLGLGQKYPIPVPSQFYGTVPDPAWLRKKYDREWQAYDTVNTTIGQGYMLVNPTQLAVMSARIATGKNVIPRLIMNQKKPVMETLNIDPEHLLYVHEAMSDVVNGPGTAGRARLPLENVKMAGKTGTAQVVNLDYGRGGNDVAWKYRDHGLFVCFAPYDNPRYAAAVVIEHGGGSGAAYPVARDVLTFLYDREKAMDVLTGLEKSWGGTIQERMDTKMAAYRSKKQLEKAIAEGTAPPPPAASDAAETGGGD
ncbi:penicillin-binding protein 2 [Parasphingorhabdus flavimaris]|jgi:penicillin-binding protein 2|uniref:Penicillin-binding protein 2 n=1 Tax=Parasphingorhabdus flavimaris TaxID=266812 RepID=A0ABX2N290_9SPHN|nr:penicillin-binding protein 2 [Parasphingorhabdus flavimaris]NVD27701.1 penicillin-binding protein 2 [Parasphingorhabdus flavimaris]|tara:strand:+ start:628 stop:2592 length:1965 start_codon:yes stop_codon:yes gene_type:complete